MRTIKELRDRLAWKYHCVFPDVALKLVEYGATLVDVRDSPDWRTGHVPLARHIPFDELPQRLEELPDRRPVIFVSGSGRRAKRAAAYLAGQGHNASNITGGMRAWTRAGLPVRGSDGAPGSIV